MYTNNSMSNNNINKFYRPATWESICFNDPEKAAIPDMKVIPVNMPLLLNPVKLVIK